MRKVLLGTNIAFPIASWYCDWIGQKALGFSFMASAHALLAAGMFLPANSWLGPVVSRLPEQPDFEGQLWLTIDDGPDPEDTPQLLEMLDQAGVRATFFFIGEKVERWPALAKEVSARGHQIGNHTWSHPAGSFWCAGPRRIKREIEKAQRVIGETVGVNPEWFRAPAGLKSPFLHPTLDRLGLGLLAWDARGNDGVCRNPDRVAKNLESKMGSGSIVLMHEGRESTLGGRLAPQVLDRLFKIATRKELRWREPLQRFH